MTERSQLLTAKSDFDFLTAALYASLVSPVSQSSLTDYFQRSCEVVLPLLTSAAATVSNTLAWLDDLESRVRALENPVTPTSTTAARR